MKRLVPTLAIRCAFICPLPVLAQDREWKTLNSQVMSLYRQGNYLLRIASAWKHA
jgi:hypothetical protein